MGASRERGDAEMRSTQELEQEIRTCSDPAALAGGEYALPPLSEYLSALVEARGLTVREAIRACNLERSYGYQVFNGTRRATRNILLTLALALGLSEAEAQRLLKIGGRQSLYARNRRDAAVLYALTHDLGLEGADELLRSLGEEALL